jgi:4-hydroxythreonine-4-phosphate dehydrogenase
MKPVIAVTTGDPFGIGPEICLEGAASAKVHEVCRPLLIGDRRHLLRVAHGLPKSPISNPVAWPEAPSFEFSARGAREQEAILPEEWGDCPAILDLSDLPDESHTGPSAVGGAAALRYVKQAVGLARSGRVAAVVTAPLSKRALHLAGEDYPGHTELLAELCGVGREKVAMMFVSSDLKVALQTVHLGLKKAIAALSVDEIVSRLALVHAEHRRWFGSEPRIVLCALNPHAGEEGLFGDEERTILRPAVQRAARLGVRVSGPFPADTAMVRAARGEFDVVHALYHDQAMIAVKARSFGSAVNLTLGLPFPRTSVDHGTAYDIAGRGVADPGSLIEAILLAARLTHRG